MNRPEPPQSPSERYLDSLRDMLKHSRLPMPDAVDMADKALAKEMGIEL